jgi:thiol-disulfide isomerase/thioredoxin
MLTGPLGLHATKTLTGAIMNCLRYTAVTLVLLSITATATLAIELGDPAPPLKVKEWVKGDPVNLKDGKGEKIYVVEFWATWCGPCIRGIPHLTELQKEYKDKGVVFIGISSSDKNLKTVKSFVKEMGDNMAYTVAYEESGSTPTSDAYMKAFKKNGIPQCFVIDKKGLIVWEGHPMFGLDAVIKKILTGDYSVKELQKVAEAAVEKAKKEQEAAVRAASAYLELVSEEGKVAESKELGNKVMEAIQDNAGFLNDISWRILTDESVKSRDLDLALKMAKKANELSNGKNAAILDTYARALFDTGSVDKAIEHQEKAVKLAEGNPMMQAELKKALDRYREAAKG